MSSGAQFNVSFAEVEPPLQSFFLLFLKHHGQVFYFIPVLAQIYNFESHWFLKILRVA